MTKKGAKYTKNGVLATFSSPFLNGKKTKHNIHEGLL
jgi:hypothetical protein